MGMRNADSLLLAPQITCPIPKPVAMPKWAKFVIALLLLPVCGGAALAVVRVVRASSGADTVWVVLAGGAICWLVIFLMLPRPMWVYVFGHELTHAIWTWAMGGKVKKFKASAKGGHVIVSKSNFLTVLAPYFFPLYAILFAVAFKGATLLWNTAQLTVWFHLLLGLAYGFHLTLTWEVLQTEQSDISSQGYLFAATVIFLGNAVVLLVAIPLLTASVDLGSALRWWGESTWQILESIARLGRRF